MKKVMWQAPPTAELKDSNKWKDACDASDKKIKAFKGGGAALTTLVHSEASSLRELRHELFCRNSNSKPRQKPGSDEV